jgi:hypothetical protein
LAVFIEDVAFFLLMLCSLFLQLLNFQVRPLVHNWNGGIYQIELNMQHFFCPMSNYDPFAFLITTPLPFAEGCGPHWSPAREHQSYSCVR